MFTGIIQAKGSVRRVESVGGDRRLLIHTGSLDVSDAGLGGSIAVNGVCLTATAFEGGGFWADVSVETLALTTLGTLAPGSAVNLETSLTPQSALGGHLVTGHIDGVGEVVAVHDEARSVRFSFRLPDALARYVAKKGSICIDGTSLTVNGVDGSVFDVNIIPHTLQETLFGEYRVGSRVNLEVDIIARYLERLSQYPRD